MREYIKPLILALVLSVGVSYISAQVPAGTWDPPGPPSPQTNVYPPINAGSDPQTKLGGLGVLNLFVSNGLVVGNYDLSANGTAVTAPRFCIDTDCKTSWKSPKVPNTNVGAAKGYGAFVADDGVTYAVPIYEISEIVRVDTRTITPYYKPNNLPSSPYVDVYDDFRFGPSSICGAANYPKGSNGNYSCRQQTLTGTQTVCDPVSDSCSQVSTYSPLTSYRRNNTWSPPSSSGSLGDGWCPRNYYVEWVDCFK